MTNKSLKCDLMYWFELFVISFDTFDMVLYYICTTLQYTMQHGLSTPPTYPGSCKFAFLANQFWWEDFLNISNHLPDS